MGAHPREGGAKGLRFVHLLASVDVLARARPPIPKLYSRLRIAAVYVTPVSLPRSRHLNPLGGIPCGFECRPGNFTARWRYQRHRLGPSGWITLKSMNIISQSRALVRQAGSCTMSSVT